MFVGQAITLGISIAVVPFTAGTSLIASGSSLGFAGATLAKVSESKKTINKQVHDDRKSLNQLREEAKRHYPFSDESDEEEDGSLLYGFSIGVLGVTGVIKNKNQPT